MLLPKFSENAGIIRACFEFHFSFSVGEGSKQQLKASTLSHLPLPVNNEALRAAQQRLKNLFARGYDFDAFTDPIFNNSNNSSSNTTSLV
jgi:hypothetical protein